MSKLVVTTNISINEENVLNWYNFFVQDIQPQLVGLSNLYDGTNKIEKAQQQVISDNIIHVNYASMITNNAVNYFIGKEITYNFNDKSNENYFRKLMRNNNERTENKSIAKDVSKYGLAYELIGNRTDKSIFYKKLETLNSFMVVNDTILQDFVCAVTFCNVKNNQNNNVIKGHVYTIDEIIEFNLNSNILKFTDRKPNVFKGHIPVVLHINNDEMKGDFEIVNELIVAYSKLISCSFDDFEHIANALLLFYNTVLNEEDEQKLNQIRALALTGENAKAEYVHKKLDSASFETLRNIIKEDIFSISNVPDLTDKNFSGNQSGISIAYKLLGFENLRLDKVAYFEQAILKRWEIISSYIANNIEIKDDIFTLTFYANLPENIAQDLEYAKLWQMGAISLETMLTKMETIKYASEELRRIEAEKTARLEYSKNIELPKPTLRV